MESVKLHISRFDPETKASGWSDFEVELREKTTVLDCLDRIQRTQDPSLGFRYACRSGMCGSCSMVVNGRERWTCRTLVRNLNVREITLEPMRHFPVVRDLAVDFKPLWEKYRKIQPAFEAAPSGIRRFSKLEIREHREQIAPNLQCISCGACYSSCGFVGRDPQYLGPHALNRAFTIIEDTRDGASETRLNVVDNEHGCWKCHIQMNCTEVCPMELSPSAGIQHLKRRLVRRRLLSPSRRKFTYAALGAAMASVVGYIASEKPEWVSVGPAVELPLESFRLFTHAGKGAFLRRDSSGSIVALSERCTHQGCRVHWIAADREFQCPCHRGVFDPAGVPIAGPPVRPLARLQTETTSGNVRILI